MPHHLKQTLTKENLFHIKKIKIKCLIVIASELKVAIKSCLILELMTVTTNTSLPRCIGCGKETSFEMCINNVVCFVLDKLKLQVIYIFVNCSKSRIIREHIFN
jgi:hypothetical protein